MKLIIDIPEETYQIIRDTQHLGDSGEATLENVLIRAVEKGEKQRTGHWFHEYKDQSNHICSVCKYESARRWNFCPKCGANMIESQESENEK